MITLTPNAEEMASIAVMLRDLPANAKFGASVGLNRTANEIQDAIRANLPGKFILRRQAFIESTIYRKPGEDFASKDSLQAGVRIHDDRNVLAKFEEGGMKRPTDGRKFVAVPIGARPTFESVVPTRLTLKALFFNQLNILSQAKSLLNAKGRQRKTLLKRSTADDVYVQDGKVWQVGGADHAGHRKLLWVFKPETKLPKSLAFVETGTRVANTRLADNVSGAIQLEIDRGLTSSNGPQS